MLKNEFVEGAICDPLIYFKSPEEVIANPILSRSEKLKILESWKDLCQKRDLAEYEGMRNVKEDMLPEINEKIMELMAADVYLEPI